MAPPRRPCHRASWTTCPTAPSQAAGNRIHFVVDDIAAEVEWLRSAGLTFRNEIVSGPGGKQILVDDPSRNPIELLQPAV